MKRLFLCLAVFSLCLTSCARTYRDTTLYQSSGKAKPIVAFLPVVDNSDNSHFKWDLSQELTEQIRKRFLESSRVYLLREEGSKSAAVALATTAPHTIAKDMIGNYGAAEFIVVTEFLDQHEETFGLTKARPDQDRLKEVGATLSMDMRVQVIDIRGDNPKIVLQEIVHAEHDIARAYLHCDYSKNRFGTEGFENTPVGRAHAKLARDIVAHVEGYVGAS